MKSFEVKSKELETSLQRLITKDEELRILQIKLDDSAKSNNLLHEQVDKLDELDKIQVSSKMNCNFDSFQFIAEEE